MIEAPSREMRLLTPVIKYKFVGLSTRSMFIPIVRYRISPTAGDYVLTVTLTVLVGPFIVVAVIVYVPRLSFVKRTDPLELVDPFGAMQLIDFNVSLPVTSAQYENISSIVFEYSTDNTPESDSSVSSVAEWILSNELPDTHREQPEKVDDAFITAEQPRQ
jgi:hypothetical protein